MPFSELNFFANHNKIFGPIRFRVIRSPANSRCAIDPDFKSIVSTCYGAYSLFNEETQPFGPGNKYTHNTASQNGETVFVSRTITFSGAGYVVDMPTNYTEAVNLYQQLRDDSFVDRSTRALFIDWNTFNPATNLFVASRIAFEFPHTGGVIPYHTYSPLNLFRYRSTARGGAAIFLEVMLLIFVIFYSADYIHSIVTTRENKYHFFKKPWNMLDFFNLLFFVALFIVRCFGESWIQDSLSFSKDALKLKTKYVPLNYISYVLNTERYIAGFNGFLTWLKILKFLQDFKSMRDLFDTFQKSAADLLIFAILFFIFFLGLAQTGFLFFSPDVYSFRSFTISIVTLFRGLVGGLDVDELSEANRIFGPAYFSIFNFICVLILINVFLAIINDSFEKTIENSENFLNDAMQVVDDNDLNNDGKLDKNELAQMISDKNQLSLGKASQAAQKAINEFDVNNDGVLDAAEVAAMSRRYSIARGAASLPGIVPEVPALNVAAISEANSTAVTEVSVKPVADMINKVHEEHMAELEKLYAVIADLQGAK